MSYFIMKKCEPFTVANFNTHSSLENAMDEIKTLKEPEMFRAIKDIDWLKLSEVKMAREKNLKK